MMSQKPLQAVICKGFCVSGIYHRQMKIRFLKISQVIDNQVIVKNIETENSIADGIPATARKLTGNCQ
jgi:hypothetical protein